MATLAPPAPTVEQIKQINFDSLAYTAKKKQTPREKLLAKMERIVPWKALLTLIEEHYPKRGKA